MENGNIVLFVSLVVILSIGFYMGYKYGNQQIQKKGGK